jgi:hypothetical protein
MIQNVVRRTKLAMFKANSRVSMPRNTAKSMIKQNTSGFKVFNKSNEFGKLILMGRSKKIYHGTPLSSRLTNVSKFIKIRFMLECFKYKFDM